MLCECCKKNKAIVKDFRETKTGYSKFYVCRECFNLTDETFFRRMRAKTKKVTKTS